QSSEECGGGAAPDAPRGHERGSIRRSGFRSRRLPRYRGDHGESGSGDLLRYLGRPFGGSFGRARLDRLEVCAGMALVFGSRRQPLVSAGTSFPSAEPRNLGDCFRVHGSGIAPEPQRGTLMVGQLSGPANSQVMELRWTSAWRANGLTKPSVFT